MEESIYYELDDNLDHIRAIVVDKDTLDLGLWGDTVNWVDQETYNSIRAAKEEAEKEAIKEESQDK